MGKDKKAAAAAAQQEIKPTKFMKDGMMEYHSPTLHVSCTVFLITDSFVCSIAKMK